MLRRDPRFGLLVALTVAAIVGVLVCLVVEIGRPYPGFFFSSDFRVFPATVSSRTAGLEYGDRIVAVDGHSPIALMARVEAARSPIRYEVERAGRRFSLELAPATFTRGLLRQALRCLLRRVRGHAGGGALRLRPEPRRRSEPQLPRLHVSLGRVQRGRARGRAGAEEVRGHPGELRAAAPVRPRLGLLPDVSGEPRACRHGWRSIA